MMTPTGRNKAPKLVISQTGQIERHDEGVQAKVSGTRKVAKLELNDGHRRTGVIVISLVVVVAVAVGLAVTVTGTSSSRTRGCCSKSYKSCDATTCGTTEADCFACTTNLSTTWLTSGALDSECMKRWDYCDVTAEDCCSGLTCSTDESGSWACLADHDNMTTSPTGQPTRDPTPTMQYDNMTTSPTGQPTRDPSPTMQYDNNVTTTPTGQPTRDPSPTMQYDNITTTPTGQPTRDPTPTLLSTTNTMNAWEVFQGLEALTQQNDDTPPTSALVAEGGVAGSGEAVVSESQGYALLITGTVLASWDTHAGRVSGADRDDVVLAFQHYFSFWQKMCQNSRGYTTCQPNGELCYDSSRSKSSVCLPDWKQEADGSSTISTGAAPDGDEDAIVGIMLAVNAVESDVVKPSWYDDARRWADASATAFFEFNVNSDMEGYHLLKLGACWGGWESDGNNPSYHSPGSYKIMRDYQKRFPVSDRSGYSGIPEDEWNSLISTSYAVLEAVQCSDNGAMVPNWATIEIVGDKMRHSGGSFSGSGTPQNEYGAEASRTTFRVALDAALYPDDDSDWSGYLSSYLVRLRSGYTGAAPTYWSSNTFPSCTIPAANQTVYVFTSWLENAFMYAPTLSSLVAGTPQEKYMIDAAGLVLSQGLSPHYYSRCWTLLSNLMLSGALESAGKEFHG